MRGLDVLGHRRTFSGRLGFLPKVMAGLKVIRNEDTTLPTPIEEAILMPSLR
jgi:hypothetical protein